MRSRLRLMGVVAIATPALVLATGAQAKGAHRDPGRQPQGREEVIDEHGPHFDSIAKAIKQRPRGGHRLRLRGHRRRGQGQPGSSALEIKKNLELVGAGADQVTVTPKKHDENRIAADAPD